MFTQLTNSFGESYLHEINGGVFNEVSSKARYQSYFSEQLFDSQTFYLIIGSDAGLLINYLRDSAIDSESQYLFVELEPVIQQMALTEKSLPNNIAVTTFNAWRGIADTKKWIAYCLTGKTRIMRSLAAVDCFCQDYRELNYCLEQDFFQAEWNVGISFAGFSFIEQQLKNISENMIPASCLRHKFQGMEAVILAAGPSLNDLLPWVKKNKRHLIIVAVSRVSQQLMDMGICPDFIMAIDPTDKMFDVSKSMLKMSQGPIFVNADYVTSKLLGQWSGQHIYMGSRLPWGCTNDEDNLLVQGPTVTNAALNFLIETGVQAIYLAGVDLCYSHEGFSHASENLQEEPNLGFSGHPVLLNDGTVGETEPGFFAAIETLGKQGELALQKNCRVINLSPRAAKMDNIEFYSTEQVDLSDKYIDKQQLLHLIPEVGSTSFKKCCDEDLQSIDDLQRQLMKMARLAKEALSLNKKLNNYNAKKVQRLEGKILAFDELLQLVKLNNYKSFAVLCNASLKNELSLCDIKQAGHDFFSAVVDSCQDFRKKLDDCVKRITCRKMELSDTFDVSYLAEQWEKDGHYARALKWDQSNVFDSVKENYNKQFEIQFANKKDKYSDISYLRDIQHNLYRHYRSQDKAALVVMIEHLNANKDEKAQGLANLGKAYVAELSDDSETAVSFYYRAAKEKFFEEVSLSHLSSLLIHVRDMENAWLTLQCLSEIAPGYLPQYAHLSYLLGNSSEAIRAYEIYLQQAPKDTATRTRYEALLTRS